MDVCELPVGIRRLQSLLHEPVTGISTTVSPDDVMYASDPALYFNWGQMAMRCIRLALAAAGTDRIGRILDLPCGHGRVLRTLKAAFPEARVTACDIDRDAVDFCVRTFGAERLYSARDPEELDLPEKFDLIWCGSLFTHLSAARWGGFLRLFERALEPGGVCVFSAHGPWIAHRLERGDLDVGLAPDVVRAVLDSFGKAGFGYADYALQDEYGISLSSPAWVCDEIAKSTRLRLLTYAERGWYYHHDSVACVRAAE